MYMYCTFQTKCTFYCTFTILVLMAKYNREMNSLIVGSTSQLGILCTLKGQLCSSHVVDNR